MADDYLFEGTSIVGRFGKLMVLGIAPRDKHGHFRYHCRCDCGNKIEVRRSILEGGQQSCQPCARKRPRELKKRNRMKSSLSSLFSKPRITTEDETILKNFRFLLGPESKERDREMSKRAAEIRQERRNAGIVEMGYDWLINNLESASTDGERQDIHDRYFQCSHPDKQRGHIFVEKNNKRIDLKPGEKGTACSGCKYVKAEERLPLEEQYKAMEVYIRYLEQKYGIKE